jgi:hypothetical protein
MSSAFFYLKHQHTHYVETCNMVEKTEEDFATQDLGRNWDRCYDFLSIFAENFCENIGVFDSKQS